MHFEASPTNKTQLIEKNMTELADKKIVEMKLLDNKILAVS